MSGTAPDFEVEPIEGVHRGPLEDGTILCRFKWTASGDPNAQMNMKFKLSFDVTLKKGLAEAQQSPSLQHSWHH